MRVTSFAEADGLILSTYAVAAAAFTQLGKFDTFQSVVTATVHPEKVSQFLELCYANREALPPEINAAAADIGAFAAVHGFYGLDTDQRGLRMVQVLSGETIFDVPEPDNRYVSAPPVSEV